MRSCEYSNVNGERKTKLLTLNNLCFYKDNKQLSLHDKNLHNADCMKITFEFQKTDKKNQPVYHHRSGHPFLCPIIVWSSIVKRILNYPGSSLASSVNLVQLPDKRTQQLSNNFLLSKIRSAAATMGFESLGFFPSDIGLHSLRSGAAMAMYLAGIPPSTIKITGRWSSEAFMDYIRPQIAKFSSHLSSSMISHATLITIPDSYNVVRPSELPTDFQPQFGHSNPFVSPNPIVLCH
jgi:hypothetical protein